MYILIKVGDEERILSRLKRIRDLIQEVEKMVLEVQGKEKDDEKK